MDIVTHATGPYKQATRFTGWAPCSRMGRITLKGANPTMSLSCLLIVDVQAGFINTATAHIPGQVEPLQAAYDRVFITRFFNPPISPFRSWMGYTRCARDSDDFKLAFKAREDARLLDKDRYTCVGPAFLDTLAGHNVHQVDVCGLDTDICVTKCAVDLFENGIRPIVLAGYCASSGGERAHLAGLATLARYLGNDQIKHGVVVSRGY